MKEWWAQTKAWETCKALWIRVIVVQLRNQRRLLVRRSVPPAPGTTTRRLSRYPRLSSGECGRTLTPRWTPTCTLGQPAALLSKGDGPHLYNPREVNRVQVRREGKERLTRGMRSNQSRRRSYLLQTRMEMEWEEMILASHWRATSDERAEYWTMRKTFRKSNPCKNEEFEFFLNNT